MGWLDSAHHDEKTPTLPPLRRTARYQHESVGVVVIVAFVRRETDSRPERRKPIARTVSCARGQAVRAVVESESKKETTVSFLFSPEYQGNNGGHHDIEADEQGATYKAIPFHGSRFP